MQFVHGVTAFESSSTVPAAHCVHAEAFSPEEKPAPQAVHAPDLLAVEENPAVQMMHSVLES